MNKSKLKIILTIFASCTLFACSAGDGNTSTTIAKTEGIEDIESNIPPIIPTPEPSIPPLLPDPIVDPQIEPKINVKVISHAWYPESNVYEAGESLTIHATLLESGTTATAKTIRLDTDNSDLIYQASECTIESNGACDINVLIAESATLGSHFLSIKSDAILGGTTQLNFEVVAGNIILLTENDTRQGNFAQGAKPNEVVDEWCNAYVKNGESSPNLTDRYRKKSYKGMIQGNPATSTGKVYYRDDGKTKVAIATGNYLAQSLVNSVIYTDGGIDNLVEKEVWTGASENNCNTWATASAGSNRGRVGVTTSSILNSQWWDRQSRSCSKRHPIYCVSQ